MTRKTFREKLGVFIITLGVLGGLYGLFSTVARAASTPEDDDTRPHQHTSAHQEALDVLAFEKEELEDMLAATKATLAEVRALKAALQAKLDQRHADDEALEKIVGTVWGETGVDGLDAFMQYLKEKIEQEGRLLVPGALLSGSFTLENLLRVIEANKA